jgi:phosphoenolpyruvate phosphomutase / 2-hydroxyethylphosphonate cytidylyltransferase
MLKEKIMKKVYVGMSADVFHHGHVNIINEAGKHGDVIVGLLNDKAVAGHKRLPYLNWENRKKIIENIKGVTEVFEQLEWDYAPTILKYKPDYMVHGTDWLQGPLAPYRDLAIKALESYGGKLIEVEYTKDVSSTELSLKQRVIGTTPDIRKATLRRLLDAKDMTRIMEAHNPLSALILENLIVNQNGKSEQFDGFWSSSLTDSTSQGKPDIEALEINSRLSNINNIFDVTTKPLIMDADTGGKIEHFELNVRSMERLGISAVIIEDKKGLKKNSLFGNEVKQEQENKEYFAKKIEAGRASRISENFMVIARIESLILEKGINDAIERANTYVDVGVDGIMIHSKKNTPDEIFEFSKIFRKNHKFIPLVSVPSTYNAVTEDELVKNGFNIVIYANQMLRAAYPAMHKVAESILKNGRSLEVDKDLIKIKKILELIPGTK